MGNSAKLEAFRQASRKRSARQAGSVPPAQMALRLVSARAVLDAPRSTMFVLLALHLVVGVAVVAAGRPLGRRAFVVAAMAPRPR